MIDIRFGYTKIIKFTSDEINEFLLALCTGFNHNLKASSFCILCSVKTYFLCFNKLSTYRCIMAMSFTCITIGG